MILSLPKSALVTQNYTIQNYANIFHRVTDEFRVVVRQQYCTDQWSMIHHQCRRYAIASNTTKQTSNYTTYYYLCVSKEEQRSSTALPFLWLTLTNTSNTKIHPPVPGRSCCRVYFKRKATVKTLMTDLYIAPIVPSSPLPRRGSSTHNTPIHTSTYMYLPKYVVLHDTCAHTLLYTV